MDGADQITIWRLKSSNLLLEPKFFIVKEEVLMRESPSIVYREVNPARALFHSPNVHLTLLFLCHFPLVYLLQASPVASTVHAIGVFLLGIWFIIHDANPRRLVYVLGYIVGAEVLWRMTDARVFWEFGKYSVAFLMLGGILKWHFRLRVMPLLYFVPLLPSAILTLGGYGFSDARQQISFNLSGPFALAIGVLFFSQLRLNRPMLERLLLFIIMPIAGIAFIVLRRIRELGAISFDLASNFSTSGGFGPNQVSAILGLGALLAWLFVLIAQRSKARWPMFLLLLWFLAQAALTFSRGGLVNFVVAAPLATLYLLRGQGRAIRNLAFGVLVLAALAYIIFPQLDEYTGGQLEARYAETNTTGRDLLWQSDLQIWQDNFLFGVGPGRSTLYHPLFQDQFVITHTEYSRLLAEHGLFGVFALFILGLLALRAYLSASNSLAKGLAIALILWSFAEMSHAAMRVVAISFLFALPLSQFDD
jgi:hypothetical protein